MVIWRLFSYLLSVGYVLGDATKEFGGDLHPSQPNDHYQFDNERVRNACECNKHL